MPKVDIEAIREYLNTLERGRAARLIGAITLAVILVFAALWAVRGYREVQRLVGVKKEDLKRFEALAAEYVQKREVVEAGRRKASAGAGSSLESIMEEAGKRTGIRIASIKTIEEQAVSGYTEKEAEVKLEGAELNNLINFLYSLKTSQALIVVREFAMKSRFEDPNRLDVTLRVSHGRRG